MEPSLAEVRRLAVDHNLVAVHRDDLADTITPVTAYWRLNGDRPGFLLESVEGGEFLGRYSFIGGEPRATVTFSAGKATTVWANGSTEVTDVTDPIAHLEALMAPFRPAPSEGLRGRFSGGLVGYLGYEAAGYFERVPAAATDPLGVAEGVFFLVDNVVVFDHLLHRRTIIAHVHLEEGADVDAAYWSAVRRVDEIARILDRDEFPPGPEYTAVPAGPGQRSAPGGAPARPEATEHWNLDRAEFADRVDRCREYILAGDVFQVQLSRRLAIPMKAHPFYLYRVLRTVNPSPYMYYLRLAGHAGERARGTAIVGTSPETLVRVEEGEVEYRPIAGTRRRGVDEADDRRLEAELVGSEKERAEHLMLVDLGRNDVGRFAAVGSVEVTELMRVERFSAVMHMVSRIRARLAPGRTAFDALRSCFPAGTVTGAPKIRAMEIIAEMEPEARGIYAGAVGYASFAGNLDVCIAIRTVVVKDGFAYVQAAGGIVADSTADEEFLETENKTAALRRAVAAAHQAQL